MAEGRGGISLLRGGLRSGWHFSLEGWSKTEVESPLEGWPKTKVESLTQLEIFLITNSAALAARRLTSSPLESAKVIASSFFNS